MSEYNTLKNQMKSEWFNLQRQIHSGLDIFGDKHARCEYLEHVLQSEYGVEVRRK